MTPVSKAAATVTETGIWPEYGQDRAAPGWYAVHTRSNCEKRLSTELARKGFHCYPALLRETRQWKDRKKVVERPLFPGYLFVLFSGGSEEQLAILRSPGAVRILASAGVPERILASQMDAVRTMVAAGVPLAVSPALERGTAVRVRSGPLAGITGTLLRTKNMHRLVVTIDLLSQSVATEIDVNDVELLATPDAFSAAAWRTR